METLMVEWGESRLLFLNIHMTKLKAKYVYGEELQTIQPENLFVIFNYLSE